MKNYSTRLAALEALEAARRPDVPTYVCMHQADFAALDDVATPADVKAAIAESYRLCGDQQKWYIGLCMCDAGESCRVCGDRSVVRE